MKLEVCMEKVAGIPKEVYWALVYQDNIINYTMKDVIKYSDVTSGTILLDNLIINPSDVSPEEIEYLKELKVKLENLKKQNNAQVSNQATEAINSQTIALEYLENFITEYEEMKKSL